MSQTPHVSLFDTIHNGKKVLDKSQGVAIMKTPFKEV